MTVSKAGIIIKKDAAEPERISRELIGWFATKAITTVIDRVDPDLDLLVILGGDGTLLHIAATASRYDIPVVGVNLGGLGFLTEVAVPETYQTLNAILAGEVAVEERMMLKTRRIRAGRPSSYQYCLNEVVISKGNIDQLVQLRTWADDQYVASYRADGLIFSTPTGSTAYNLSAGGPVVEPTMDTILVTPICPFMLESRPVLLGPAVRLTTRLAGTANDLKVIVDGRLAWDMRENDLLEVEKAEKPLRLLGSPQKGYFEILRNKLNWGGGEGPPPAG
jgi:NAD+ kinase